MATDWPDDGAMGQIAIATDWPDDGAMGQIAIAHKLREETIVSKILARKESTLGLIRDAYRAFKLSSFRSFDSCSWVGLRRKLGRGEKHGRKPALKLVRTRNDAVEKM
ncbi:hypothetical protein R6Q57_008149 [Mikania cordata]